MWETIFISLIWVAIVQGQNFGYDNNLDTLGERISAHVQQQVAPLEGLGQRISDEVNRNVGRAQVQLHSRLKDLDGLGDRISQQVYENLEPVRAIELNFKIRDGVGGTTIATHSPSGRKFIIKNYKLHTCSGTINDDTGECAGSITPFTINHSSAQSEWCFIRSYSLVNDQVCMSLGSVTVQAINNQVTCKNIDNNPSVVMSLDAYKKLCSDVSSTVEYRYVPNENDAAHVSIPNQNKYVNCENNQKNLCIFHERNNLLDTYVGNGIQVFNRGGNYNLFVSNY